MKKLVTILFTIFAMVSMSAQNATELKDIIYTSNNKVVEAKVIEVSSKEVKYKDWDNQDGPMFILSTDEVKKIEFSNGTVKKFTDNKSDSASKLPIGFQFNADIDGNLSFINGYYTSGYTISNYTAGGVSGLLGVGVRLGKFLYTGVASGVQCEWGKPTVKDGQNSYAASVAAYVVPIYADIRAYAPTGGNCYPFAEIGIGGYVGLGGNINCDGQNTSAKPNGGFYFVSGAGLEFKYLTLGIGYKLLRNADLIGNHAYIKVGVSLGSTQKVRK